MASTATLPLVGVGVPLLGNTIKASCLPFDFPFFFSFSSAWAASGKSNSHQFAAIDTRLDIDIDVRGCPFSSYFI